MTQKSKKHISDLFVRLRGPLYNDGSGEVYTVEFDGDWGKDIGCKNQSCLSIKQGYSDEYVRIDINHISALIDDLQEVLNQVSGYNTEPKDL